MNTASPETPKRIRECAIKEFEQKGFRGASLRNIVKSAGVTTGAFYGYYSSKGELFDALVGSHAQQLTDIFVSGQKQLLKAIKERDSARFSKINRKRLVGMTELAYRHTELTRLVLCSSEGTKYENFIHSMAEAEIGATCKLRAAMRENGSDSAMKELDPYFEHIILSGMISSLFEPVIHNASKSRALKLADQLNDFYSYGLTRQMGF